MNKIIIPKNRPARHKKKKTPNKQKNNKKQKERTKGAKKF